MCVCKREVEGGWVSSTERKGEILFAPARVAVCVSVSVCTVSVCVCVCE